jgi:hypothetical protein
VCAIRGGAEWSGLLGLALLAVMTVTVAKAMVVIAEQQQQHPKRAIAPNESRESCLLQPWSGTAAGGSTAASRFSSPLLAAAEARCIFASQIRIPAAKLQRVLHP